MKSSVLTASLDGIECSLIEVQLDVAPGLPSVTIVGKVPATSQESFERVKVVLRDLGYPLPANRYMINLAPSETPKHRMAMDLALAITFLIHAKIIQQETMNRIVVLGELDLNGNVLPLPNILPYIYGVSRKGMRYFIIPAANATEASYVPGIKVVGVHSLREVLSFASAGKAKKNSFVIPDTTTFSPVQGTAADFASVKGEPLAKMALEVAAAGHFHVLLTGAPGTGKTTLIHCLPGIMPLPTVEECLEMTTLHSLAGLLPKDVHILDHRPFYEVHHTVSPQALVGGGVIPKPGLISLAHNGVLFLDELPEFGPELLNSLRQPISNREIEISRVQNSIRFPADFLLVAAANPCPCGYFPDRIRCSCSSVERKRYQRRVPGPILDRLTIRVAMNGLDIGQILNAVSKPSLYSGYDATCKKGVSEKRTVYGKSQFDDAMWFGKNNSTEEIRSRVWHASEVQRERFKGSPYKYNSELNLSDAFQMCEFTRAAKTELETMFPSRNVCMRSLLSIVQLAITIADLKGRESVTSDFVYLASLLHPLDNEWHH